MLYEVITHFKPLDEIRLFLNGNLQLCSTDEARYHESLVHPAMALAQARSRVLILGGGDGCALREVLKYPDVDQITLVDLDPAMTTLRITSYNVCYTKLLRSHPQQQYVRAAGSLGWAFPASLGVKCAAPDRPVICFTGDGAFWYHLSELETAKRWGIKTVTIVNNNRITSYNVCYTKLLRA